MNIRNGKLSYFLHKSFIFLYEVLKDETPELGYNKDRNRRDDRWRSNGP
ncbi:hypothetical protein HOLDEFILI_01808 [Holdemania filiformis DSM 12042]|uniref:Uncharacterized protein n=1 Tax=Holdemania filiformis DSM 12042 TaxID=545696 RepID=B9Y7L3_9FIRM|nr:hypothetical protein HOLDEFILI_01808 [Holdemania filiformis DSM 12042]